MRLPARRREFHVREPANGAVNELDRRTVGPCGIRGAVAGQRPDVPRQTPVPSGDERRGSNAAQIRGWVANRFHYQRNIPIKDAAILSNCPDHEVRGAGSGASLDDGQGPGQGGIEAGPSGGGCRSGTRGLLDERLVLPGVRSAVESYVRLAREEPWPVAVASSLTELFAPDLMAERIRAFERHYPWVPDWGMEYFRARLVQAGSTRTRDWN